MRKSDISTIVNLTGLPAVVKPWVNGRFLVSFFSDETAERKEDVFCGNSAWVGQVCSVECRGWAPSLRLPDRRLRLRGRLWCGGCEELDRESLGEE